MGLGNLFEAIGFFSSDGGLSLWNNRFMALWGFEEEQLAQHPRFDTLTPHLAARLKRSSHAGLVRELVRSATQERKARSAERHKQIKLAEARGEKHIGADYSHEDDGEL